MLDPDRADEETQGALELAKHEALTAIVGLEEKPAVSPAAAERLEQFAYALPEEGVGAEAALGELVEALDAAPRSSGPRWFGFVTGGATPAALGADWLASALDQNAALWVHSPLASQLEAVSLRWLIAMFGLPSQWAGVLTDGATMANFVGLAAARRWWGERHGVNIDNDGFAGLGPVPVFAGGYVHSSVRKALGMLGLGRARVEVLESSASGSFDLDALDERLRGLSGAPAIVLATAGEVNAGRFDPIERLAELADQYGAWLHVDGAFGLFARLSAKSASLVDGVERASSVAADGHKWLNVPYDCGFAFVRDPDALRRSFSVLAPYLDQPTPAQPSFQTHAPQGSRRARSFAVWASLRAYGRSGYRSLVERHLELAQRLADQVDNAPDLERLADVPLNVVCFRFRPPRVREVELDELNLRLERAVQRDGRIFVGTTRFRGHVAFRPAILNWRMRERDVDMIVEVIRELGHRLLGGFTDDADGTRRSPQVG
jgi:glutamate/tyrosine decarboxylase-like PLP-dependent enzyme